MGDSETLPVLILGGGINGSAIARELILRRIPVVLVEPNDIAFGATSRSSRLIHGGLRYLEYGEFQLVRESLHERKWLLRMAPHLVQPLRMHTPVEFRMSGWWQAIRRFLGFRVAKPSPRGLWLLQWGLWLYQKYAADPRSRPVATNKPGIGEAPPLNSALYRWVCSYDDGQVMYPERLVIEWLEDARRFASSHGVEFCVLTGSTAKREGEYVDVALPSKADGQPGSHRRIRPRLIINATGGWVDRTLQQLEAPSRRLMGGSKGSHLLCQNEALRDSLQGDAVYVEASDGRPVFIMPMGELALVGTTDIPFDEAPADAIADQSEIDYLIEAIRRVFPNVNAQSSDVVAHYAGVRPLPFSDASTPGAVSRGHSLHVHDDATPPIISVVGGKLTTCRSLAEETAEWVLTHHGAGGEHASTRSRPTPGGENYPTQNERAGRIEALAEQSGFPAVVASAVWNLYGSRTQSVLNQVADYGEAAKVLLDPQAPLPVGLARFAIEHEWARSLEDVVERRMMLVYRPSIRRSWLKKISLECTPGASDEQHQAAVERCVDRLRSYFGRECLGRNVEDD